MTREEAISKAIKETRATRLTHLVCENGWGGYVARMLVQETDRDGAFVEVKHISDLGQVVQVIELY